jgi:hypothetical protein
MIYLKGGSMHEFTIYRRQGFSVVPLIRGYQVKREGKEIYRFATHEVDEAIELVDELATGIQREKVA